MTGRRQAARLLMNLTARFGRESTSVFPMQINGTPGVCVNSASTWLAVIVEPAGVHVGAVDVVVNPAKLPRLVAAIPGARDLPTPSTAGNRFRHRQGRRLASDA